VGVYDSKARRLVPLDGDPAGATDLALVPVQVRP